MTNGENEMENHPLLPPTVPTPPLTVRIAPVCVALIELTQYHIYNLFFWRSTKATYL